MQERFDKASAIKAIVLFKSFIENSDLKEKINNSNRELIALTTVAYLGSCYKARIERAIPVMGINLALEDLISKGYVTKTREGREVRYTIADHEDFKRATFKYDQNTAYLFANVLMNVTTYIKKYDIKSWNILAMMLEIALKHDFETSTVKLDENDITSITGCSSNKMNTRANMERMGIIMGTEKKGGRTYGGTFKVNQKAFIFQVR